MAKVPPAREAPQTLTELMRPSEAAPPSNGATVQPSNVATGWGLASFKIRKATETAFKNHIRTRQGQGEKITIGSEMDAILTAWLKTQGVEV